MLFFIHLPLFRFNRQTDPTLARQIEEVWTERVSKEPWLFNGSKFRLHSFHLASPASVSSSSVTPKPPPCTHSPHVPILDHAEDQEGELNSRKSTEENSCTSDSLHDTAQNNLDRGNTHVNQAENTENTDDQETGPLLTLRLGLTCYKDYLGTNWSCRAAELRQLGEVEFGDALALLAQPLGVGAVLCTDDGQVVLIRRSQRVAEAGGLLDIPGGHPEPKVRRNKVNEMSLTCHQYAWCVVVYHRRRPQVVCERLGQAVCEEQISVDMMQQRLVVSELFSSVCAEIRDEVGFSAKQCLKQKAAFPYFGNLHAF